MKPRTSESLGDSNPYEYVLKRFANHLALELGPLLARMQQGATVDRGGWVDQHHSDLSPRRHCRAVRERLETHKETPEASGAKKVGNRYLLTVEAMEEEMNRPRIKPVAKTKPIDPEMAGAERVKHLLGGK